MTPPGKSNLNQSLILVIGRVAPRQIVQVKKTNESETIFENPANLRPSIRFCRHCFQVKNNLQNSESELKPHLDASEFLAWLIVPSVGDLSTYMPVSLISEPEL